MTLFHSKRLRRVLLFVLCFGFELILRPGGAILTPHVAKMENGN